MAVSLNRSTAECMIRTLTTPVFLAGIDLRRIPVLTLHITRSGARRQLKREIQGKLAQAGYPDIRCSVKRHKPGSLERADTIQKLLHRFRHDEIIYDPTASIQRARAILQAAQGIRRRLGDKVAGICFDAWQRTLHIGLEKEAFTSTGSADPINELREVEAEI